MRKPIVSMTLVALALVPFATLAAQEPAPPLEPGTRVRVTAPALGIEKQVAMFESVRGDTLVMLADTRMIPCPLSSVTRIDRYHGRKSWGWWKGALIGLGAGATAGAIWGAFEYEAGNCGSFDESDCIVLGAIIIGVPATLVGGVVGALIRTDRWEEVPLDQLRVSFVPRRDGLALSISVAF
jgi:hypothetical protein